MTKPGLLQQAHALISQHLHAGDAAIDATAGNGHDTLFLAQQVGKHGKVYAFDIQQQALDNSYALLREHDATQQVSLVHAGHETVMYNTAEEYHLNGISAVMFNLGYLPGGDKARTTQPSTSLAALQSVLQMLKSDGIITIMMYRAHPGGMEESVAIKQWSVRLNTDCFQTTVINSPHDNPASPQLLIIQALGS